MIFEGINIQTATLEELKEMELGHVAKQLLALAETKRLCSLEGKEVIAEYGLKGNFDEVVRQLDDYSLEVEAVGFIDEERPDIIRRKVRLCLHRDKTETEIEYQGIHEAVCAGDKEKVIDLANQAVMMANAAHDNKMCECFTNSL